MTDLAELKSNDGQSEATVPKRYEYEPLPTHEHTRVLVLEPGPNDSDDNENTLVGSLRLLDLCDADSEPFEAISYVWGLSAKTHVILVDGRPLPITANLRGALLQTRLLDRPRTLWADAICIDQWDHIEKGHQVAAMGRIYKTSKRTLICLGVGYPEHARDAAGLIDDVNTMIENTLQSPNFSGGARSFEFPAADDPIPRDPRWNSGWDVMLRQQWFKRGWVVQEASLRPDADILWASVQIVWDSVLRVNYWLEYRGRYTHGTQGRGFSTRMLSVHHNHNFAFRHPEEAILFNENALYAASGSTLVMLFETRMLELSDPRDRIYAFMALETNDGIMADLQLEPDYNRPHLDTYREFAFKYIEKTGDLKILSFIKHNEESLARAGRRAVADRPATPENIPSWIPRWDLERSLRIPIRAELCDHSKEFIFREGGSILGVRGLILGSVEYFARQEPYCPSDRADLVSRLVFLLWKDVAAQSSLEQGLYSGREAFAFFDVLCPVRQSMTPEEWSTSRAEFVHILQLSRQQQTQDFGHASGTSAVTKLAEQIRRKGRRRFVILSQGYYGVAPPLAQNGDVYALIYGTETLSLLRPVEGKPGYYKIVGPIYVESKTVLKPHGSNMMGRKGCRDWEEWNLTGEDINLC